MSKKIRDPPVPGGVWLEDILERNPSPGIWNFSTFNNLPEPEHNYLPSMTSHLISDSPPTTFKSVPKRYEVLPTASTYAEGVHALREACLKDPNSLQPELTFTDGTSIIRPPTSKEILEARVNHYENHTGEERLKLLTHPCLDSCGGILYKANTTKFKIIPICRQLITIGVEFDNHFINVPDYDLVAGIELDGKDSKYHQLLTKDEIISHPGWLALAEDDKPLLKTHVDIVFKEFKNIYNNGKMPEKLMGFYIRNKPLQNELRALCVGSLNFSSLANGYYDLSGVGRFFRVTQIKPPKAD